MINDLDIVQWDYLLSPEFEMVNSAGKPLTGGYIEVYIHGTRNKYYCASDFNGTLHPFQIPLDSLGSNIVLASPDKAYDVYVYNKYGSLIMSRYNVHCQGGGSGSGTYVGDKLFYGQYTAQNASEIVSLNKTKGNIDIDSDGYLQLKEGMSYHITVRGAFQVNDVTNTETTLNYIEYSTISPIKVDVDFTKADPQNFELSYDIYDLAEDMAYQVAFEQINGMVTDLVVEVHSLSNLATTATFDYEAGDYISIVDNTISVTGINPEDYSTHSETYESIVTAIELVSSIIPEAQVQSNWTETDNTDPSYIQNKPNEYTVIAGQNIGITIDNNDFIISASGTDLTGYVTDEQLQDAVELVTGLIPDVSDLTTHTEVYEATVTAIEAATAVIPDTEEVQFEEINLSDYALATAIPVVTGYATHSEVHESIVSAVEYVTGIIPDAQVQSDWTETDTEDPAYIQNKPIEYNLVAGQNIGITLDSVNSEIVIAASATDLSDYITNEELQDVVELVTGLIPTDYATPEDVQDAVEFVTGLIPDVSNLATKDELQDGLELVTGLIPTDYATDEELQDTIELVTGKIPVLPEEEEVEFEEINLTDYALVSAIPDVSGLATKEELQDDIELVTGLIPDVSDFVTEEQITGFIPYSASGVELPNSNFKITPDGQAYKVGSSNTVTGTKNGNATEFINNTLKSNTKYYPEGYTGTVTNATVQYWDMNTFNWAYYNVTVESDGFTITDTIPSDTDTCNIRIWIDNTRIEPPFSLVEANGGVEIPYALATDIPVVTGFATKEELQDGLEVVTGLIPTDYTTHDEVYEATVSAIEVATGAIPDTEDVQFEVLDITQFAQASAIPVVTGFATKDELQDGLELVTGLIPDTEDVQFEELDITQFAQASAIPDISNLASKDELQDGLELVTGLIPTDYTSHNEVYESIVTAIDFVSGIIPDAQVQSDWDQADNTKVDYIKNKPEEFGLVAGQNIGITTDSLNYNIVISATGIPTVQLNSNNQVTGINDYEIAGGGGGTTYTAGEYISIDSNDVISVTGVAAATAIPESKEVTFEEIDLNDYALASAIPDVTNFATEADVYNAVVTGVQVATGAIPVFTEGNCIDITSNVISWETTAGITDIQMVTALPQDPVSSVLYIIPEA